MDLEKVYVVGQRWKQNWTVLRRIVRKVQEEVKQEQWGVYMGKENGHLVRL